MTDQTHPLSVTQKLVFGNDAVLHEITGMVIEQGSGAHLPDVQARLVHIPEIRRTGGPEAADAMLLKLNAAARGLAVEQSLPPTEGRQVQASDLPAI